MTASRKIPPHLTRELARHIQPRSKTQGSGNATLSSGSIDNNATWEKNNKKLVTIIGCFAFVGATASLPFWAMKWIGPLNEKDGALTGSQIRRGAFNNSGSRDVGKDPDWDFKTGTRKRDKDYVDLFLKDNPNEVDHADGFMQAAKRRTNR